MCVCARAEQKLSRQTGRERERERDVCARAEQKLSRQTGRERDVCAHTKTARPLNHVAVPAILRLNKSLF